MQSLSLAGLCKQEPLCPLERWLRLDVIKSSKGYLRTDRSEDSEYIPSLDDAYCLILGGRSCESTNNNIIHGHTMIPPSESPTDQVNSLRPCFSGDWLLTILTRLPVSTSPLEVRCALVK